VKTLLEKEPVFQTAEEEAFISGIGL